MSLCDYRRPRGGIPMESLSPNPENDVLTGVGGTGM
jgi:hypothetical protein